MCFLSKFFPVRPFRKHVEDCDQLQGFHVLMDLHNAWSGVSCELLSHMADEYARSPVLVFGNSCQTTAPPDTVFVLRVFLFFFLGNLNDFFFVQKPSAWKARALINSGLVLQNITKLSASCTYIPLSVENIKNKFPGLTINTEDVFSSSALLALTIHNATLPYRLILSPRNTAIVFPIKLFPDYPKTSLLYPECSLVNISCRSFDLFFLLLI